MTKYRITDSITHYYETIIEADSVEEALKIGVNMGYDEHEHSYTVEDYTEICEEEDEEV